MCLAIPMRVLAVDGLWAHCEARGSERRVNLFVLQHETVRPGDVLAVHADAALRTMSSEEAQATWALLDEILAVQGEVDPAGLTRPA